MFAMRQRFFTRQLPQILQRPSSILQEPRRHFNNTSQARQQFGRSYTRFQNTKNIFQRWSQRPTFYYEVGGLGAGVGGFYIYNLETVPVSGRRRFNIFGPDYEKNMAKTEASSVLQMFGGQLLSDRDPRTRQVKRVMNRLIPCSGLTDLDWEIYVVESELVNAMVVPGGKVFVFTGIMQYAKDDDALAAILGHEISHATARHVSERMSRYSLIWLAAMASDWLLGTGVLGQVVLTYGFEMPNGRVQETEADYLGLLLMAQACYNPVGAIRFWERMAKGHSNQEPPQFLSTHPSSVNRIERLKEWLPEAEAKRSASDCASTLEQAQAFQMALPQVKW